MTEDWKQKIRRHALVGVIAAIGFALAPLVNPTL